MIESHRRLAVIAAVALAAIAIHLPTVGFGFVFDDQSVVAGTPGLRGWGSAGLHLLNLLIHAANAAILAALLFRLGVGARAAIFGTLLFIVHPISGWSVASIAARGELLAGFFALTAWLVFAGPSTAGDRPELPGDSAGHAPGSGRDVAIGLLFLVALIGNLAAIGLVAVPLLSRPPARRAMLACAAAILVAAGLRLLAGVPMTIDRAAVDPIANPIAHLPGSTRTGAALGLAARSIGHLVAPIVPFRDVAHYGPGYEPGAGWIAGALVLVALASATVLLWWRGSRLAPPAGFALMSFLPASHLVLPIGRLYRLNDLYLPLIGIAVVAAAGLDRLESPAPSRSRLLRLPAWPAIAIPLVALIASVDFRQILDWRSDERLFTSWTNRYPNYSLAHGRLGAARLGAADPAGALAPLRRAIELDERNAEAHYHLGVALIQAGQGRADLEAALAANQQAIALRPGLVQAHANAARILLLIGRPQEAEAAARQAIALDPEFMAAHAHLAEALFRQERYDEAARGFAGLVPLSPGDPEIRSPLIVSLIHTGDLAAARREAEAARAAFPDMAWFDFCLARVAAREGRRDEALGLLRASFSRHPGTAFWLKQVTDFDRWRADLEGLAGE
jgi:tetratricopeptide (TPR) repeat protein